MSRPHDRKKSRRTSSDRFETLEPRTLLTGSTFDVTTSADSGVGSLRQAITEADALGPAQQVSIIFDLPQTDPGYVPTTGGWTINLLSALPVLNSSSVTIDASAGPFNISAPIDLASPAGSTSFTLIGDGSDPVLDLPDPINPDSGTITTNGLSIAYSSLASLTALNFSGLTLETPNSTNTLAVTSPALAENQIAGSSGGVAITPLTFASVSNVTITTSVNDTAGSDNLISISNSGLVAAGLQNFAIQTGTANSTLSISSPSLALPVSGGSFVDEAGSGNNTIIAQADVNYSLTPNSLSIPWSGSVELFNVQSAQLTGGSDSSSLLVNSWAGNLTLNGGGGSDQLQANLPGSYSGNFSLSGFSTSSILVQGDFLGTISAPQTSTINQVVIYGNDDAGSSITAGAFVPAFGPGGPSVFVTGDFGGSITASLNTAIPGSGILSSIQINGNVLADNGLISTGSIGTLGVGGNFAGVALAIGTSTIGSISVGGNLSGTVRAPEDPTPGSGVIGTIDVGGTVTGIISGGNISGIRIGKDLIGVIIASGAGTIGTITVGGNLSGTVMAPEDPNPGSGTIGSVNVGGSLTGTVSSGNISGITIGKDLIGVVIASGAGTIGNVIVGGNLSGLVDAELDPNSSTSAELTSITVDGTLTGTIDAVRQVGSGSLNAVGSTGSLVAGNVTSGLSINSNAGSISAANVASFVGNSDIGGSVSLTSVTNLSLGTLSGSFTYQSSGQSGSITIGMVTSSGSLVGSSTAGDVSIGTLVGKVNLGVAGNVEYQTLAPGSEIDATAITSLLVEGDLAGLVDVSGNLGSVAIGNNLTGEIEVTGSLGSVSVGGATPGSIVAGNIGTVSAVAGVGPIVLQITEGGIERELQAATTSNLFLLPGTPSTESTTTFRYLYESGSLSNPQLTVQMSGFTSNSSLTPFDLSLITHSATAKFNLARLDSVGASGAVNVTVEGDILTSVSNQAANFFGTDANKAGIQLPLDNLAGVAVRDFIPSGGYINAASIQAIAAGRVGLSWGGSVVGAQASAYEVQSLLGPTTRIVQAENTFEVPFSGNPAGQVGFFMDDSKSGQLDWDNVSFTIQNDITYDQTTNQNDVAISNQERGADIALLSVGNTSLNGNSQILGITIMGDGASISTYQWVDGPIISYDSLGDLWLLNPSPVQDISASSIFGTITSYAHFTGTIQTTGLWTDPITGTVSDVPGDFGRVYLNSSNQIATTSFETYTGDFTGQLIVRGDLLGNVILNGNSTGAIAAQENIGSFDGSSRLGGITINGNESGSIAALGQIIGNLTINGNLGKTGSITACGGILGNLTINGNMSSGSKIVSGGSIGNSELGTELTVYGNLKGLIAADGSLIEWPYDYSPSNTFENLGSINNSNLDAIDAVLAGSVSGGSDLTTLGLTGYSTDLTDYDSMMTMLAKLHIGKDGKLTVIANS